MRSRLLGTVLAAAVVFTRLVGGIQDHVGANGGSSSYDYIVVGAGACGSVIATRLAEAGRTVLVLETGEDERKNPLSRWGYFFPSTYFSHLYRNYFSEPEVGLNNRRLYHMSTKALGGATAVNGMVWTRGDPRDWDLIDLRGWTYEDVLPYFKKTETYTGDDPDNYRGHDGPIILRTFEPNTASQAAVETAARLFGVPAVADNNAAIHESSSIVQRNFKGTAVDHGERWGAYRAYLEPARTLYPQTLEVVTHATVFQILFDTTEEGEPPKATGVYFLREGVPYQAHARHEVVLSAGAFGSPKLLMLSGVGDCQRLEALGIDCLVDSPGVGQHLVDHINPGSISFIGPPRTDYDANIVACYTRTGVLKEEITPDVELGFIMGPPSEDPSMWEDVPSMYTFYSLWLLHDGIGNLTLKTKDPLEDPVIVSGFMRTQADEQKLVRLFRMLIQWAETFQKTTGIQLRQSSKPGGNSIMATANSTDDEILRSAKAVIQSHKHVSLTCRMGPASDRRAVVGETFRVHGVGGLRVVDASSQPVLTNGHPMAVLLMMAERASEWILAGEGATEGEDGPAGGT